LTAGPFCGFGEFRSGSDYGEYLKDGDVEVNGTMIHDDSEARLTGNDDQL
jgi:hypothetical protein